MTTENDELMNLPPRGIDILLGLDTYQGMTDEEIELVLEWKIRDAVLDADNLAIMNAHAQLVNEIAESEISSMREAQSLTESLISGTIALKEVPLDE